MTATIPAMGRPRGELSERTLSILATARENAESAENDYRLCVLGALEEGSFAAVSSATGLSTNTLQRWKREAQDSA